VAQHTQIANSLKEAFSIRKGEVISLVGAGGKSSLMQALADELAATGGTVITTTTTKIFDWQAPSPHLIVEADEDKMLGLLLEALGNINMLHWLKTDCYKVANWMALAPSSSNA